MNEIKFTVPAIPIAQPRQRQRVATINGRPMAMNYTPTKSPVNAFKATVRMAAQQVYSGPPLTGPLWMELVFVFPRPGRLIWKKRPMPRERHASKPDRDNCEKSVMDSLKGLLFIDDGQICDGPIQKWIAAGDEQPHVEILIRVAELADNMPVEAKLFS